MDNISFRSKSISNFIDRVLKTNDELETTPIPELYGIPISIFNGNQFYKIRGFGGINGMQIITTKQTILNESPDIEPKMHWELYYRICSRIYKTKKLNKVCAHLGKQAYSNVSYPDENVNHISLRYVNAIREKDGEIDVTNICVIYGDLNRINSYQKRILLESIQTIDVKDHSCQIYHYDSGKQITAEDISIIIPIDSILLDDEEELLSTANTEYVSDISNFQSNNLVDCVYVYSKTSDCITPIAKFSVPNYERLKEYGLRVIEPYTLNKMIINKTKIMPLVDYINSQSAYSDKSKKHV